MLSLRKGLQQSIIDEFNLEGDITMTLISESMMTGKQLPLADDKAVSRLDTLREQVVFSATVRSGVMHRDSLCDSCVHTRSARRVHLNRIA